MKVWPLLVACLATGAVHSAVMHNYGTSAFLLQWENFTALRGCPRLVWSDKGSQLTSAGNYITWTAREDPSNWGWDAISAQAARQGTTWKFVPAGCQFRNGLAEARVKAMKQTLMHTMVGSTINAKPTVTYAELQVFLARAAGIVNDRPLGLRSFTGEDLVPLTPNQLLLGRTGVSPPVYSSEQIENFEMRNKYQEELLDIWWKQWFVQVFPNLLPYQRYKDSKRHRDLQVDDVCLLKYDGKVRGTYRLCRVVKLFPDEHDVVRTVEVELRPRRKQEPSLPYQPRPMDKMQVGVQRLVLIVAHEDQPRADQH